MQYSYIEPRFFIEEKIVDKLLGETGDTNTYMFRCIHGKAETFSVSVHNDINAYDIELNLLKPRQHNYTLDYNIFLRMKNNAEILAKPFEFVRIDFYLDKDDNIYFSEFTFTPLAGKQYFTNEIETKLGKLWI